MADNHLVPVATFDPVYQIEQQDPWVGGVGGLANKQGQNLANRTEWLKTQQLLLAPLLSPEFSGSPKAPTAAPGSNNLEIANTAFVVAAIAALINSAPGALDTLNELAAAIGDDANFAATVTNALALKANLLSPVFTGIPEGPTAAPGTNTTQFATTAYVQAAVAGYSLPVYTLATLPAGNVGPAIFVADGDGMWEWVSTAYFTGYRHPHCGMRIPGDIHSTVQSWAIDAIGGNFSKLSVTGSRIWSKAQENGLNVANGVWVAGAHWFVDNGDNTIKCCDLRNTFDRSSAGATDADTANAVPLGAYKDDTTKAHTHGPSGSSGFLGNSGGTLQGLTAGSVVRNMSSTGSSGTAETAPKQTAYKPRIHI